MGYLADARDTLSRLFARRYATMFGTARVYETSWGNTRIRVLDIGDTYQSATYLDDRWCRVPFPYLGLYDAVFEGAHPARDLCVLGGGGYAFPKQVIAFHPEARIDVVEIDPAITRIAYERFFMNRLESVYHATESGRLATFNRDAYSYLQECASAGRRYDAIINDCFAAGTPDKSLVTADAAELIHTCLLPQGRYLTNIITALEGDDADPLQDLVRLLSERFLHICALSCDRRNPFEADNVVVVASNEDMDLHHSIPLYDAT